MNSSDKKTAGTQSERRQPLLAFVGAISIVVGLVVAGFGLTQLSNDRYVIGWVLVAVAGALVLGGIIVLAWKSQPGRVSV